MSAVLREMLGEGSDPNTTPSESERVPRYRWASLSEDGEVFNDIGHLDTADNRAFLFDYGIRSLLCGRTELVESRMRDIRTYG